VSNRHTRREFFALTGVAIAGAAGVARLGAQGDRAPGTPAAPRAAATAASGSADLIVVNARVYTMESGAPRADAFAVKGGRFIAVGGSTEVKGLAGKDTTTFDAKQMTVVPGFTDCHNHAPGETLLYEVLVGNPFEVEFVTIASIVDKLRAKAKQTPPGTWVEGYFFDDTKVKEKRELNVHDLDQVSKDHPVVVHHRGGHTSFYNSNALQIAGVTKSTPNPAGGTFDHDEGGGLNGRVTDRARAIFDKVGMRPTFTEAELGRRRREGLAHISKQFVRYGLTTVHHQGGDLVALQDVRARGELLHRVSYESSGREIGRASCRERV